VFANRFKHRDGPIGIDVGVGQVRLLQLSERGGRRALAAATVPLPETSAAPGTNPLAEALRQARRDAGFTGPRTVSVLPADQTQSKNLRMPALPGDELAAAVRWEAAERMRIDADRSVVQHLQAGVIHQGDQERLELIVLATRLDDVQQHLQTLRDLGLRPEAVDARATALCRALSAGDEASRDDRPHVVLDIGQRRTQVLIVRGGAIQFYKTIEIGADRLDAELSGRLGLPLEIARSLREAVAAARLAPADTPLLAGQSHGREAVLGAMRDGMNELAREIGLCLRYYGVTFRGNRPTHGKVVGGLAQPWLAEHVGAAAGLTLTLDNPLAGIDLSAVRDQIPVGTEGRWAVAAGLALRGLKSAVPLPLPDDTPASREVAA
jgi:type IV pilus assembly protein PilM